MARFSAQQLNPHILTCGFLDSQTHPLDTAAFPPRKVKWYELELILWGEGHIFTNNVKIPAARGAVFFRQPGMIVQGVLPYSSYLVIFDMVHDDVKSSAYSDRQCFDLNGEDPVINAYENQNHDGIAFDFPEMTFTKQFDRMKELFSEMYGEFIAPQKGSDFYMKTLLMQLLMLHHKELNSASGHGSQRRSHRINMKKILNAKKLIDANISSRFTLSGLAGSAGLSPNFFCRIFKEIIGETPVDYINRGKIITAKKMLLETDLSIKKIAYALGFENETYFFTLFKKLEGSSPLDYRIKNSALYFYKNA